MISAQALVRLEHVCQATAQLIEQRIVLSTVVAASGSDRNGCDLTTHSKCSI